LGVEQSLRKFNKGDRYRNHDTGPPPESQDISFLTTFPTLHYRQGYFDKMAFIALNMGGSAWPYFPGSPE